MSQVLKHGARRRRPGPFPPQSRQNLRRRAGAASRAQPVPFQPPVRDRTSLAGATAPRRGGSSALQAALPRLTCCGHRGSEPVPARPRARRSDLQDLWERPLLLHLGTDSPLVRLEICSVASHIPYFKRPERFLESFWVVLRAFPIGDKNKRKSDGNRSKVSTLVGTPPSAKKCKVPFLKKKIRKENCTLTTCASPFRLRSGRSRGPRADHLQDDASEGSPTRISSPWVRKKVGGGSRVMQMWVVAAGFGLRPPASLRGEASTGGERGRRDS